jgi:hypothetical protein
MKKEQLGDNTARLVGHGMIFFHDADGGDTLIRNGVSTSYSCAESEGQGGLTNAEVQSYLAAPTARGSGPPDASRQAHPSSGKVHGGTGPQVDLSRDLRWADR